MKTFSREAIVHSNAHRRALVHSYAIFHMMLEHYVKPCTLEGNVQAMQTQITIMHSVYTPIKSLLLPPGNSGAPKIAL